jgi:hypothetical protein
VCLYDFACQNIVLLFHTCYHATLFSHFILFIFATKYSFTVHFNHECAFSSFFCCCAYFTYLGFPPKMYPKCLYNKPPTLTCGSSQTTQACSVTLLHASMKFWKVSLTTATFFVTSASFPKISSTTYVVSVVSFSSVSCVSFFVMPYTVSNFPLILSDSFCKGSNLCAIFCFSARIFSIRCISVYLQGWLSPVQQAVVC